MYHELSVSATLVGKLVLCSVVFVQYTIDRSVFGSWGFRVKYVGGEFMGAWFLFLAGWVIEGVILGGGG